jgi:mRNA interferase RelE/StbE
MARLGRPVAARVVEGLEDLAATGRGDVRRVRGTEDEWRLRVGDWRIRFRYVSGTSVLEVLRVRRRDEAYRD